MVGVTAPLELPARAAGATGAAHPDTSPPPPEESPFSGADDFCTPSDPPTGVALGASMSGVSPTTVDATLFVDATDPAPATAAALGSRFARQVNACGGIHGRRLALHTVVATGDTATDCTAVIATGAAVVVATGSPGLDDCVRSNPGLVVVAPEAAAANELLATTHGRLFVGASTEGRIDAEVQDLVDHADLASAPFAVITGTDDVATAFRGALDGALTGHALHAALDLRTDLASADPAARRKVAQGLRAAGVRSVLTGTAGPDLLRVLSQLRQPPTVYAMEHGAPTTGTATDANTVGTAASLPVRVESWTAPGAAAAAEGLGPSEFTTRCSDWAVAAVPGARVSTTTTTTTTPATGAPGPASVCLAMRLLARGLFLAGPNPTRRDVVRAFHNLPYTDRTGPDGEPVPRPNQLVNEPVRRVATVVVRTVATTPCPPSRAGGASTPSVKPPSTTAGPASSCWVPVSGYDEGGREVDAALTSAAQPG